MQRSWECLGALAIGLLMLMATLQTSVIAEEGWV
jgi:hypothetical protein